jgi:LppP/LprE lipoprotein
MLLIAPIRPAILGGIVLSAVAIVSWTHARSQPAAVSWLDAPHIEPWNRPGMSIPIAAQGQKNPDPRCRELTRSPQSEEDRQLRARGWDLIGPPTAHRQIRVIGGAANYDGMCRPLEYQQFVFVRGVFAGTLSPQAMDSRTDGALGHVTILSDRKLQAEYLRYTATDPLCCPSSTTSVVFDIEKDPPLLRPVSARTVSNQPAPPP